MSRFLQQYWSTILALLLSGLAFVVSIKAWHKSRAVYGIKRKLYFRKPDSNGPNNNKELAKMLSSGKYTILHVQDYGGYPEIILGKIKKN
jgi:hypothetical protein